MDMVCPLFQVMPGQANPPRIFKLKVEGSCGETQDDLAEPISPRKASLSLKQERPYRKPTLVGRDKSPKVIERTLAKELGNLTP